MILRGVRIALAAQLALAVLDPTALAAQYFVDPLGSDNGGGAAGAPWRTLQHAANVVAPGDQVTVRAGNYAGFYLDTSGTPSAPIEFRAEPGTFITQRNPTTPDGINLERASHVVIDGFQVSNMPRAGVRVVGSASDFAEFVTIRNVRAHDNFKWGILTGHVDDLLIENNHTSGSADEHGIYVSNSGDRPTVRNNTIWGNNGNGIHMNGDLSLGGDGVISGALVSGNTIFDNGLGGGSGINMDGVQDSRIENNLLYNNHASGISLYRIDGGQPSTGNVVVNNTVHQAANGRWALNIQHGSTDNTVLNNILVSAHPYRGAIDVSASSLPGLVSDYNVVISRFTTNGGDSIMPLAEWQAQTGNDAHSLVASAAALFVDPATGDYHLLDTAPARNAGTAALAPAMDLDGLPRPIGDAFDIGAYEWRTAGLTGDFNDDGAVDTADYTLWRDTLGASVPPFTGADSNGNGVVDANDYLQWKASFGSGPAGSKLAETAPEPATALYISVGLLVILLGRFQFRR